jgi:metallo-beta-lactamase family protein
MAKERAMGARAEYTIQFFGAAGTVTGSKHLLRHGDRSILLDCGLFQGEKELRLRNWSEPPFAPSSVDAVVLSHAHLDHSGYLPVLVRRGFEGPIHCTPGTRDLLKILLLDAAHLQEEEAAYANRHGTSKHHPALPLFAEEDVAPVLARLQVHPYGKAFEAAPGVRCTLRRAGHILGSAIIALELEGVNASSLAFTGDLGRPGQVILRDPEHIEHADVLLLESTYGDRRHAPDPTEELARVVREAAARGGALLIPTFAVGRAQTLIWLLRQLEEQERIPRLPVAIDSPMANRVSEVTCRHEADLDEDMLQAMDERRCPLCCKQYELCSTVEESRVLNDRKGPMILLAGSGMVAGGRILHHLTRRLGDRRTTVLLVGYQALGTRGRALQDGASQIKIFGRQVGVHARIETIDGLSAHADREETRAWLGGFVQPPRMTYLVHGEPPAAEALRSMISELGWKVSIARDGERVALGEPR